MVTLSLARNKLRETHKATKSRFLRDLSGIESDKTISMFFVETETFLKRERETKSAFNFKSAAAAATSFLFQDFYQTRFCLEILFK